MFELQNSGKNRRKLSEFFFENLPRAYKDLIKVKKNSKISHACVPLRFRLLFFLDEDNVEPGSGGTRDELDETGGWHPY
jgi:hypothetical protein